VAADQMEVPAQLVAALRAVCLALPEAHEEEAWVGTRWRVGKATFAHILGIRGGWPPAYARAAATDGPAVVLTFRSSGAELAALAGAGPPYFKPPWHPQVVGVVLGTAGGPDEDELAELLTESYCLLAPRRLVELVDRPPTPG
jgi:YjbR